MRDLIILYALVALSFGLLMTACNPNPVLNVEPKYQKYVKLFEIESINFKHPVIISNLKIKTVPNLGNSNLGVCYRFRLNPTIFISNRFWETLSELEKEILLFHEISHCVLGRPHKNQVDDDGIPVSIMNPYMLSPYVYFVKRKYYLEELFSN